MAGRSPVEDARHAVDQDALESEPLDAARKLVVVDQLRIAKDAWGRAEDVGHSLSVSRYLERELVPVHDRAQRMVIRLTEELHAPRRGERLEALEHVGRVGRELVDDRSGQAEGHRERSGRPGEHIGEQPIRRPVALVGDTPDDLGVLGVVEVGGAIADTDIEDRERTEPVRLVDLEVEADGGHQAVPARTRSYNPAMRSPAWVQLHRSIDAWLRSVSVSRRCACSSAAMIRSATCCTFQKSTSSTSRASSLTPAPRLTITGVPARIASSAERPNGSDTDGMTNTSAIAKSRFASSDVTSPAKTMLAPISRPATCSMSRGRISPSPATTNNTSGRRDSTQRAASTK